MKAFFPGLPHSRMNDFSSGLRAKGPRFLSPALWAGSLTMHLSPESAPQRGAIPWRLVPPPEYRSPSGRDQKPPAGLYDIPALRTGLRNADPSGQKLTPKGRNLLEQIKMEVKLP